MSVIIKKSDITRENVDAIVNAANSLLCGGGGVDGAIHRAAGPLLLERCKEIISKIKRLDPGGAVITESFGIKNVKYIIHTVGPVWRGGSYNEEYTLFKCYENSFKLAMDNKIKTISFPSISTGAYGYPVEKASLIAIKSAIKFNGYFDEIHFVLFSDYDLKVYEREFKKYEVK